MLFFAELIHDVTLNKSKHEGVGLNFKIYRYIIALDIARRGIDILVGTDVGIKNRSHWRVCHISFYLSIKFAFGLYNSYINHQKFKIYTKVPSFLVPRSYPEDHTS